MSNVAIAIHGGAGTLLPGSMTAEKEIAYKNALEQALDLGYAVLLDGGSAVLAVETAVASLEDCPLFNAGRGSVFTASETHEMDACIMDGKTLNAGAVSLVTGIKNPIKLAKEVMENSGHVFLAGAGAMEFALKQGFETLDSSYFYDAFRHNQWKEACGTDDFMLDHSVSKENKFGTVGAVACDIAGNVAAATSTGGMTNKKFGRVGDSPIVGAGNYANNSTCAVSCTGSGEFFIRAVTAYNVSALMEYKNFTLEQAALETVHKRLMEIGGDGGLIAVDTKGNITMPFNTEGMYRASIDRNGTKKVAIYID